MYLFALAHCARQNLSTLALPNHLGRFMRAPRSRSGEEGGKKEGYVGCPNAFAVGRIKRALFSVGQFGSDLAAFATTSLAACGLAGPFESVARIQLVLILSFPVLSADNDLDASTTKKTAFRAL